MIGEILICFRTFEILVFVRSPKGIVHLPRSYAASVDSRLRYVDAHPRSVFFRSPLQDPGVLSFSRSPTFRPVAPQCKTSCLFTYLFERVRSIFFSLLASPPTSALNLSRTEAYLSLSGFLFSCPFFLATVLTDFSPLILLQENTFPNVSDFSALVSPFFALFMPPTSVMSAQLSVYLLRVRLEQRPVIPVWNISSPRYLADGCTFCMPVGAFGRFFKCLEGFF